MHKIPLTDLEREGLEKHRLSIGQPSQLSDTFRIGMRWHEVNTQHRIAELEREKAGLVAQLKTIRNIFRSENLTQNETAIALQKLASVIDMLPEQCLNQIKAKAVVDFVDMVDNEFSTTELCAHYGSRGADASDLTEKQVVLVVDLKQAKLQYAASIAKGEAS